MPGAAGLSDGALDEKKATINEWVEEFLNGRHQRPGRGMSRSVRGKGPQPLQKDKADEQDRRASTGPGTHAGSVAWDVVLANTAFLFALVLVDPAAAGAIGSPASSAIGSSGADADDMAEDHAPDDGADNDEETADEARRRAIGNDDLNTDQDLEMPAACALLVQHAQKLPLGHAGQASQHAVSLGSVGRLALALGTSQGSEADWREGAILAAIVALRLVGPPTGSYEERKRERQLLIKILHEFTCSKSALSFSAAAKERIVTAGVAALCRITPFSSLSKKGFYDLCSAGPKCWYSGASAILEWVTEDLESFGYDAAGLVPKIAGAWPQSLPIQRSCMRLINALARDYMELRPRLIDCGGFRLAFNAMETFRDDPVLQQMTSSTVRQLALTEDHWTGFSESRDINRVVDAVLEHPWWDGTHTEQSTRTCDACCDPLLCRATGDFNYYCQTCTVAASTSQEAKHIAHLCSTCHTAFQGGNRSVHVAGHQFLPEYGEYYCAGDRCDCADDLWDGRCPHQPSCNKIHEMMQLGFMEGQYLETSMYRSDGGAGGLENVPRFPNLTFRLSLEVLQRYGKFDMELREGALMVLASLALEGLSPSLRRLPGLAGVLPSEYRDGWRRVILETKALSAMVAAVKELPRTPEVAMSFQDIAEGFPEGYSTVGLKLWPDKNDELLITGLMEDCNAASSGLEAGNVIIQVDEVSVKGMTAYDVARQMAGPTGSSVSITVSRISVINNEDGTVSTSKSTHTAVIVRDVSLDAANSKTYSKPQAQDPLVVLGVTACAAGEAADIHWPESEGGSSGVSGVEGFVDLAVLAARVVTETKSAAASGVLKAPPPRPEGTGGVGGYKQAQAAVDALARSSAANAVDAVDALAQAQAAVDALARAEHAISTLREERDLLHSELERLRNSLQVAGGQGSGGVAGGAGMPVSETGDDEDSFPTDPDSLLAMLRILFFDLTPPGALLERLLDLLRSDLAYLSELDALVALAESAHEAHPSLETYTLLVKRSHQILAQRCDARAKQALMKGGGSTYLEPLSATFRSADNVRRRMHVLLASEGTLETLVATLEGRQQGEVERKPQKAEAEGKTSSRKALDLPRTEAEQADIKRIADMKRMCQTAELLSPGQAHILKSPLCSGFLWQMY